MFSNICAYGVHFIYIYSLSHEGRSVHSSLKCSKENIKDREGKQKFFLLLIENIGVVYQLL